MTKSPEHSEEIVKKLVAALSASDEPYVFSNEEVAEIQAVLAVFRKAAALKWMGSWLLYFLVTLGLVVSNLDRIKEFLK